MRAWAAGVAALAAIVATIPAATSSSAASTSNSSTKVSSQAPATLPAPSWWNGSDCDDAHYSAVTGHHSYRLGATFLGMPACGPSPIVGGGVDVLWTHAGWGEYDFECTELAFRSMYLAYGINNAWQANGNNVVRNYRSSYGGNLQVINNGAGVAPLPGDVVSFDNPNGVGHVAIVATASIDGSGSGTVTLLTQNDTSNGSRTLSVTSDRIAGFGNNTPYGWLRQPGWWNPSPPPPPSTANLLVNGSWEQDGFVGWDHFVDGFINYATEYTPGVAKEGSGFGAAETDVSGRSFSQDVNVAPQPGSTYTFSIWLRSSTNQPYSGQLSLWALGGTSEQTPTQFTVGPQWTLVSAPLSVNATGHTALRAQVYLFTTGIDLQADGATLASGNNRNGPTAPSQPTGVAATPADGVATVQFSAPADGGSPITSYTVTSSPGGITATGGTSPIIVPGLSNGTSYTFTVTATNAIGMSLPSSPSTAITPGPTVSVGDQSLVEGNKGTRVVAVPVTLSRPAATTVSVSYTVAGITATGGSSHTTGVDFKVASGTLAFVPSATTQKTAVVAYIAVTIYGDTLVEPDETFTVTISSPAGGNYILGRNVGTGTILNDDGGANGVTISVGNGTLVKADAGTPKLTIPITLSAPLTTSTSVKYTVTPGSATYSSTATAGGDYGGATSGTITFPAGTLLKNISIPIWADPNLDTSEAFTITLSNASTPTVTVLRGTGTATVLSDPIPIGDLNLDLHVDCTDLAILQQQWHQTALGLLADLNGSGTVDIVDLAIMATHWTGPTPTSGC